MILDLKKAIGSSAIPPTPFDENDKIDINALERVYEFIVQCGSTSITTPVMVSEFEALCEDERKLMVREACEVVNKRCAIIANVTAPCMHQAAVYAEYAQECGADSVIAMGPAGSDYSYVKRFFKAISDAVTVPVMIQNHSGAGFLRPVAFLPELWRIAQATARPQKRVAKPKASNNRAMPVARG